MSDEKAVARFKDGRVVKGYLRDFRIDAETVTILAPDTREEQHVPLNELKAVFFVKTFEGSRDYNERKAYGIRENMGCKVFIKFYDRETLLGFIQGDVPWDKGFSLAKLGTGAKGFFLAPVDGGSNNDKVFVVGSAIEKITIMTGS